ncbi:hypothetical protein ATY31_14685 [Sinorhizobium americanum]|uniref:Uncharacterized protein n=1 Tax=Sinorhizobium americanum TaxID=194963 RepID=A0A2S3YNA7_9HYPH|nr:hypothetical protein ATY31_14685 [Sinorhizobium americanum]
MDAFLLAAESEGVELLKKTQVPESMQRSLLAFTMARTRDEELSSNWSSVEKKSGFLMTRPGRAC